ncbi:MAG: methylamine utilization protein [Betaproteobacteria bacterium]|nr:methylamine utilization protein [Betaproteobacteria bacterium]
MYSRVRLLALLCIALLGGAARAATVDVRVTDAQGKPVAEAVVYLESATRPAHRPRSKSPVAVAQADREFVPYVTPVLAGTAVSFPNRDPMRHHVYSFSPAKTFEIKLYRGDSPSRIVFDTPGVVALGCNIHDWMLGYLLVLETPLFDKTNADGRARIEDVAPGEYSLKLWHPDQRAAFPARTLRVTASNASEDAKFDVGPRPRRFKPPHDPSRYRE